MSRMPYPTDLTDEQWDIIKTLMPEPKLRGRRVEVDLREVVNAIFYINRAGCQCKASAYYRRNRVHGLQVCFLHKHDEFPVNQVILTIRLLLIFTKFMAKTRAVVYIISSFSYKVSRKPMKTSSLVCAGPGCQWDMLPHDFPNYKTVNWYYSLWRREGLWGRDVECASGCRARVG
jgi:transposase